MVQVPENILINKINMNDDLLINIEYNGDVDELFYSLILIYKKNVVASK